MRFLAPVLAALLATSAVAASPTSIHVVVTNDQKDGQHVDLTLPFGVAQAALGMTPVASAIQGGVVRIHDKELKVSDLRQMWLALKKSGDGDLLNVVDGSDKVRVFTRGGRLMVSVAENGRDKVKVDVPGAVIDALLSGDGDELDVAAAFAKLADCNAGEIVRVDDGASHVRVTLE